MDKLCKAFGNEQRLKLLICLEHESTVSELLEKCHLSQSALSQHLEILREAHLVVVKRDGKYMRYASKKEASEIAKLINKLH